VNDIKKGSSGICTRMTLRVFRGATPDKHQVRKRVRMVDFAEKWSKFVRGYDLQKTPFQNKFIKWSFSRDCIWQLYKFKYVCVFRLNICEVFFFFFCKG